MARFCRRLGIPRSTYYCWRDAHLSGRPHRRWPAPVVDVIEASAAEAAHRWSAWGRRKIWAMTRADGISTSQSSVYRGLKRRGLLQPGNYHAERRALAQAQARKAVFLEPPGRRNRVWQADFTRLEIATGAVWWIGPVLDYHAKVCLAAETSTTIAGRDAIAGLEGRHRRCRGNAGPLTAGGLCRFRHRRVVVTDNGAAYKSADFARFMASRPELRHVRTRHHAPETNGVVERFNASLKYEHLYPEEITSGQELVDEIEGYRDVFNSVRPHEALAVRTPHRGLPPRPELRRIFRTQVSKKVDTGHTRHRVNRSGRRGVRR